MYCISFTANNRLVCYFEHWTGSGMAGCFLTKTGHKCSHVREGSREAVRIRFHNRFICMGVDISIYVLPTGGRI